MKRKLKNQVAIISGGVGDIGFATALAMARSGADIALCDLEPSENVTDRLEQLQALGVKSFYQKVDVADSNAVCRYVEEVQNVLGIPQLIIANAAVTGIGRVHDISPEEWRRTIDVNLNGAFYFAQAATAPLLKRKLPGRVVFVGSWAGTTVHSHMPAYSVSKAGMSMLCKCLALELAPHHILVNEIAPGYVEAGLTGKIFKSDPEREKQARERVPTRLFMSAAEVADQIVYLCDPENKHITGATLLMDGGLSLKP